MNVWQWLRYPRGVKRPVLAVSSQPRLRHLRCSIENCENSIRDAKDEAAVHTLYMRFYAVELAVAYKDFQTKEQKKANILNSPRRNIRKPRIDQEKSLRESKRDKSLNWLTAQLFDDVDPGKLHSGDPRREKAKYWVRIGQPLLSLFVRSRAFLIAPGMRISQEV
jgi:hypothetical protein